MRNLFLALVFAALAPVATVAKECTADQYESDRARIIAATKDGTLKTDAESGRDGITLSVFISEAAWDRMTFLEKVDFTESLICAWAGVGKGILVLHLRSEMTGQVVGEWRVNRLTVPKTAPRVRVEKQNQVTPERPGFSCDASRKVCLCEGGAESADCTAMKKNCKGDVECTVSQGISSCACRMQVTEPTQQAPANKAPSHGEPTQRAPANKAPSHGEPTQRAPANKAPSRGASGSY